MRPKDLSSLAHLGEVLGEQADSAELLAISRCRAQMAGSLGFFGHVSQVRLQRSKRNRLRMGCRRQRNGHDPAGIDRPLLKCGKCFVLADQEKDEEESVNSEGEDGEGSAVANSMQEPCALSVRPRNTFLKNPSLDRGLEDRQLFEDVPQAGNLFMERRSNSCRQATHESHRKAARMRVLADSDCTCCTIVWSWSL